WVCNIIWPFCNPWIEMRVKPASWLDRFSPEVVCSAVKQYSHAVDTERVEPIEHIPNDFFIIPPHKQERRRPIEVVVFTRTFPYKVPRVRSVHDNKTATIDINRLETS